MSAGECPNGKLAPLIRRSGDTRVPLDCISTDRGRQQALRDDFAGRSAGIAPSIVGPQVCVIGPIEGVGKQRGAVGGGRERGRRDDGRIGADIAHGILGPDLVTVTGAGGEAGV